MSYAFWYNFFGNTSPPKGWEEFFSAGETTKPKLIISTGRIKFSNLLTACTMDVRDRLSQIAVDCYVPLGIIPHVSEDRHE